jgi:RsiW-degrading membrane proteinase PrsW (M82 family)
MPSLMGSVVSAFMVAGMPEEVIKFIAIIIFAGFPVWIIYMLIRYKKKTGEFCSMSLLPE